MKKREKREKEKSPSRKYSQVGLDLCEGTFIQNDYQIRNNTGKIHDQRGAITGRPWRQTWQIINQGRSKTINTVIKFN